MGGESRSPGLRLLRHGYETVSDHVVWDILSHHLEPLKAAVERMLNTIENSETRVRDAK